MKPRRDITLGEMQDECKKYWNNGNLGSCGKCQYMEVCCHYEAYAPAQLNLTDPPRFTEAQMDLLRGLYAAGVRATCYISDIKCIYLYDSEGGFPKGAVSIVGYDNGLEDRETLDLAELFGKDSAHAQT